MIATREVSQKRIDANRRNASKSTGPRTAEGKGRVRLNAMKHGLTATTVVLPGEDAAALEARVAAWKDDVAPRGAMEEYLVERAAHASWQLDRADRTIAARLAEQMERNAAALEAREAEQVADLARLLFWNPREPIALYAHTGSSTPYPRVSWPKLVDDPCNPHRIVLRLESMAFGCRWMLDRWAELRKVLEDGRNWQPPDRFRAVRLLGRQPMEALLDDRVLSIYLGCRAMDPKGRSTFADLLPEMSDSEFSEFSRRAEGRDVKARTPSDPAAGKALLLAIIDAAVARIEAILAVHGGSRAEGDPLRLAALAFDDSDEGERLRRYQSANSRTMLSTINALFKVRKELDLPLPEAEGPVVAPADETNPILPDVAAAPAIAEVDWSRVLSSAGIASTPDQGASGPSEPAAEAGPAPRPQDETDPAESGRHRSDETNPTASPRLDGVPLDPCSEGRHFEPAFDPPASAGTPRASRQAGQATTRRRKPSRSIPPMILDLLGNLVPPGPVDGPTTISAGLPALPADPP